jgi:hypothetical protein
MPAAALLLLSTLAGAAVPWPTLRGAVTPDGRVDYALLAGDHRLEPAVAALATAAEPTAAGPRLLFWIDAYNLLTLDLVADAWPVAGIKEIDHGKPWSTRRFSVAGRSVTLDDIEHRILRPAGDPRVHAALVCASRGCPPLATAWLSGQDADAALHAAARRWATTTAIRVDTAARTVHLSRIFDWFAEDFATDAASLPGLNAKESAAIRFLAPYLPAHAPFLLAGGYTVRWADYDWSLNRL